MYSKLFIFFVFFSTLLYSNTLQQSYFFSNPIINSTDLNASCSKNFEILRIPDGKTSYRINALVILKTFELNGCVIDSGKTKYVNFTKKSDTDYTKLQEQITAFFMSNYPTMTIKTIHLIPHGYIESLPANAKAIFDKDGYTKNKGAFYVPDSNGIRHYFEYSLDATLEVLHVTQKTSRKDSLSANNTTLKSIPFTSFRGKPLTNIPEVPYRFRSSLKEDTVITDRHIEPRPIVMRGSKVSAQVKSDTVIVEFIATATQEGGLYDIITIEKADGKRVRAKIIGENTVELQ